MRRRRPRGTAAHARRTAGLLDGLRASGLHAVPVVTGAARPLPQGVGLSVYRIVQEAVSNVLRHAPGAEARVEVSHVLGGLGLRVVNGPAARTAKASPGAGHGLLGMRERVQMLGGELAADATEDGGYEVAVFVPVVAESTVKTHVSRILVKLGLRDRTQAAVFACEAHLVTPTP